MKANFGFGTRIGYSCQRDQIIKRYRKILIIIAVMLVISATTFPVLATKMQSQNSQESNSPYLTGWWQHETGGTNLITTYYAQGQRLFLLDGGYCGVGSLSLFKSYMEAASQHGVKVIVKLVCRDNTPTGISMADFTTTVNALKGYPSLFAWSISDEPEWDSDAAVRDRHHAAMVPYYNKIKELDPNHPVFNSHDWNALCCGHDWVTQFLDVTDLVGMHAYPFYSGWAEYKGIGTVYDRWTNVTKVVQNYNAAHGTNKQFFAATMQGFGNGVSPWRNPTLNELKFQTFGAVVQGVPSVLFWMDQWAQRAGMVPMVGQVMTQLQAVGPQMNNGRTSDPSIRVSITDRNQLAYRYGSDGTTAAILAVNIANRSGSGSTLSNVKFTLPSNVRVNHVTVVSENRTIPVASDGSFTDTFQPFAVHIYTFAGSSAPANTPVIPTATKIVQPTATQTQAPIPTIPWKPSPTPKITAVPTTSLPPAGSNRLFIPVVIDTKGQ